MQEPSVLDFIKSRAHYWWQKLLNPSAVVEAESTSPEFWTEEAVKPVTVQTDSSATVSEAVRLIPWPVFLVLGLGLWAQLSLEPHQNVEHTWQLGFVFYVLTGLTLILLRSRHNWILQSWDQNISTTSQQTTFLQSSIAFIVALAFSLISFIAFTGGRFNTFNLTTWFIAILAMIIAFWFPDIQKLNWVSRLRNFISHPRLNISLDRSVLLFLAVFGFVLFFRIFRLLDVPSQMISDHAEKLLDVGDVLNGKTSTFFPRNTGREFFQFYLTAGIILLFKTGLSYLSLKIGTVSAGIITLFYIYLLGKEIGNERVGLLAMVFAGIAYWPNIISRYGLRFPFYPSFYAPALYYLVWGLRKRNRLGFILSGLFLGLGLNGYSPFRVVPFIIALAVGLYLLHKQSEGYRREAIWGFIMVAIMTFIICIPLLRYMIENPGIVFYRAMTRVGNLEQPLSGPAWQIFLQNFRNSLTMFGWDDGEIWPISVPHRPALDVVTSVFFHLGVVLLILRYIRQRHWLDVFTLVSIPLLMMPSILSLAFPGENPSLNRSAGAIIPVFLIVGLAFDAFLNALESTWSKRFAWAAGIFLVAWASLQNYDLVFNQYRKLYDQSAWNTTEMGAVVRSFTELTGSPDTAWTVGYPYWADTRLVMINAGFPFRDNAIWLQSFPDTLNDPRPKLFIINSNDEDDKNALQSLYPNGWLTEYKSKYESKNFLLFFVPAQ
jgi:dolichyl-phosphate-mannose-protein mannosyltransferase